MAHTREKERERERERGKKIAAAATTAFDILFYHIDIILKMAPNRILPWVGAQEKYH